MKKSLTAAPGINIQWPISSLILDGRKTIETRTYPLPNRYKEKTLVIIETPGRSGRFKARIVGLIRFSSCFQYGSSSEFYSDIGRHYVRKDSPWAWNENAPKWAWIIDHVTRFEQARVAPKRKGIVFTKVVKYTC